MALKRTSDPPADHGRLAEQMWTLVGGLHEEIDAAMTLLDTRPSSLPDRREVHCPHFEEFAIHALRFVAPAQLGPLAPGVPAAWAAEPMASAIRSSGEEPPPVWPSAQGRVRGQAIEPLHPAAPEAVEEWPELGELLALLDSLRAGDARVRRVAGDLLSERLRSPLSVADQ